MVTIPARILVNVLGTFYYSLNSYIIWSVNMINEKLVITATTANSWIFPHVKNWASSTDALIDDVVQCAEAGAAIAHVHLPLGAESETVARIRERSDVIIQAGMSSYLINERIAMFDAQPDMLSIILNHHDEQFTDLAVNQLHPIEELEAYCVKCRELKIAPEWEVWHTGSYWNLRHLIAKGLVDSPHILTLFFGLMPISIFSRSSCTLDTRYQTAPQAGSPHS